MLRLSKKADYALMAMKHRVDEATDGGNPKSVLANAPPSEDNFYLVPKVIE